MSKICTLINFHESIRKKYTTIKPSLVLKTGPSRRISRIKKIFKTLIQMKELKRFIITLS